ncbi:NYN domain-containing protein [Candidatus Absconditicoccus praedator]|uniref:NYN domain-containing protein n=1 Tax=Candidatus Absconditicoccus praedator TaxID=2735562 RepID=UPI001E5B0440|nr:NYN domain-containing protein [Candidatus Absconditicoccus praedator]UFX82760.1 NYN domain-containing protein [Candidatus Absconditicoccus praedator]
MKRVNVYVDGFNFYHGLEKKINDPNSKWENFFKWCNFRELSKKFIDPEAEKLQNVFYFTAYSKRNQAKLDRHKKYVKALSYFGNKIILGNFSKITRTYQKDMPILELLYNSIINKVPFGLKDKLKPELLKYQTYEEKQTDVNIAVKIVEDFFNDKFDVAIIISGDSDIIPAIKTAKKYGKNKRFVNINIPGAKGKAIKKFCDKCEIIRGEDIKNAIMPYQIQISSKETVCIPDGWR